MTGPDITPAEGRDGAVGRIALELAEMHEAGVDVAGVLADAEQEARLEVGSVAALAVVVAPGDRPPPADLDDAATAIRDAVLTIARARVDLGDHLGSALAGAAEELGSIEALVAGRPGSWEASHVRALAGSASVPDGPMGVWR